MSSLAEDIMEVVPREEWDAIAEDWNRVHPIPKDWLRLKGWPYGSVYQFCEKELNSREIEFTKLMSNPWGDEDTKVVLGFAALYPYFEISVPVLRSSDEGYYDVLNHMKQEIDSLSYINGSLCMSEVPIPVLRTFLERTGRC